MDGEEGGWRSRERERGGNYMMPPSMRICFLSLVMEGGMGGIGIVYHNINMLSILIIDYGNSQQQQQQQPPLPKPLPNPPRPPSPGTPPLPDLPSPGGGSGGGDGGGGSENQGEAGTQQEGYQVQGATTGGGHLGRKHQRTNDHGGGNGSGKRTKKGSNDDGQGLPHGNEGGGNNSGKTRQRGFGSRSRWSDPKENKGMSIVLFSILVMF